jgi:hypothetical protein
MIEELDIGGVFFTPLLGSLVIALVLWIAARAAFSRLGLYRWIWHPALFDLALLVLLFAVASRPFHSMEI